MFGLHNPAIQHKMFYLALLTPVIERICGGSAAAVGLVFQESASRLLSI